MREKNIWAHYYRKNFVMKYWNTLMVVTKINRLHKSKFKRKKVDGNYTQNYIANCISGHKPTMISRFGCFESKCLGEGYGISYGKMQNFKSSTLHTIHNNAGVFPYGEEGAKRFFEITSPTINNIDFLGVWTTEMHDYLVDQKCSEAMQIADLDCLEPFRFDDPWTKALKGKKVVVVHPFKETIESQYAKRELLFDNPKMLPQFDLRVVRAVQTIAGETDARFSDWGEALNYMFEECMKEDFDVAIIGCGAYGMPLASMLKDQGKVAIHLGGATQIIFGIKGGRWDNSPISKLYNEHWVRPLSTETPQHAVSVEKACYW